MFAFAASVARRSFIVTLLAAGFVAVACASTLAQSDPLPSWNDGAVKKSIADFVSLVTTQGGADFVAPSERIAVFDNDGTWWCERPDYFQALFALDRIRAMAPQHPDEAGPEEEFRVRTVGEKCKTLAEERAL
jgi:hypothetical protein